MQHQFTKHYTREEARSLLPRIRKWLCKLEHLREQVRKDEKRIESITRRGGDAGGDTVNRWVRTLSELREVLAEFHSRQILVKDISRGLVDFPAIIGGREVFLCWEKDEEDIEFWHDLDTGYAGRERL